jgi:hypothetical protein
VERVRGAGGVGVCREVLGLLCDDDEDVRVVAAKTVSRDLRAAFLPRPEGPDAPATAAEPGVAAGGGQAAGGVQPARAIELLFEGAGRTLGRRGPEWSRFLWALLDPAAGPEPDSTDAGRDEKGARDVTDDRVAP